ncbi:MAG: hypothetical protein ACT4PY_01260, partial [Armatimonadota bacterium]
MNPTTLSTVAHLSDHDLLARVKHLAGRERDVTAVLIAHLAELDRALTALLQDLAKQKLAAADRPRESRGIARGSRHVPAEVKRAVWSRDGGRCAFVADNGRRCTEEAFLEFH